MKSTRRMVLGLLVTALMLGAVPVWTTAPAGAATEREHKMARLINNARRNHGRRLLRFRERLADRARRHSRRMANLGQIFHSCSSCTYGENVGTHYTVRAAHRMFMNSYWHRWNILHRNYRRVGVGIVVAGGRLWITEIFVLG